VDQFEELFRFRQLAGASGPADDGAAFVSLLIAAARRREHPIYVVLTMRSDFLGDYARFRDLPEILNDSQYLIPRLNRDQRRAAIEGPIAVNGATIAPRLTQRLLNDAGEDPDVLPILQHALMRTWDAWKSAGALNRPIDLEHYFAIGGMAHGLAQHADQAYASLAPIPGAQAIAQTMFRSLCERGADYREIRRPTRLANLCEIARTDLPSMTAVIDAFRSDGRTFIMPGWPAKLEPGTVIDISHESLIRQWQTLRDWCSVRHDRPRFISGCGRRRSSGRRMRRCGAILISSARCTGSAKSDRARRGPPGTARARSSIAPSNSSGPARPRGARRPSATPRPPGSPRSANSRCARSVSARRGCRPKWGN
jgi:hypothetical protein